MAAAWDPSSMRPSPPPSHARRSQHSRTAHYMVVLAAAAVVTCLVWMHSGEGDATILIGVGEGEIGKASSSMFNRIQAMNAKLKAENKRMHKLLQLDENADMHVEAKLEQDADRARQRDHVLRKQDDKLSEELQRIVSAPTHGAPEQYTSAYVTPDRFENQPQESENVDDAVNELLRKEKAKADQKLGLVSQGHKERDLARDYLSSSSSEENGDVGLHRGSSERSPRERRKLERMEHQKYSADMKMAETDLRNGHAHRAKHEAQHALERHQAMEKLRGFEGGEERKIPEAWKLLDRTIKDDLADRMESQRVEDNMQDVVALHRDVESAKHEYEEEKQETKGEGEAGRLALMLDVPSRDGGFKAEKEITHKLEKELNEKQRAWDRADALEAAKEAAARELRRAEEGSKMAAALHAASSTAPAHRGGVAPRGEKHAAVSTKGDQGVHFVPRKYFSEKRTTQELHSPPPSYLKKKTAKMELAQPHLAPSEHSVRAAQHAAVGMVRRNERGARRSEKQTRLGKEIADADIPHAASVALYRKDVGIRAKAEDTKTKHSVKYIGVAKGVPKEAAQVSNDIVERLLKLAHAGELRSPDVTSNVLHPISDALASHTAENAELQEQTAEYKAKLLARKKAVAAKGRKVSELALRTAHVPANPPVGTPRGLRTQERASAAAAVKEAEDDAAANREAFAVGMQQQMAGQAVPDVVAAAEAVAGRQQGAGATAAANGGGGSGPGAQQRQVVAVQRHPRAPAVAREAAGGGEAGGDVKASSGGSGVWGLISAPFEAVFGDSVKHKVYLPT